MVWFKLESFLHSRAVYLSECVRLGLSSRGASRALSFRSYKTETVVEDPTLHCERTLSGLNSLFDSGRRPRIPTGSNGETPCTPHAIVTAQYTPNPTAKVEGSLSPPPSLILEFLSSNVRVWCPQKTGRREMRDSCTSAGSGLIWLVCSWVQSVGQLICLCSWGPFFALSPFCQ